VSKYVVGFLVGLIVYEVSPTSVTLYGGAFTSSPIASIYGYGDDIAGCQQISACLNYAQHNQMLTGSFSEKWSHNGVHHCK
jgi:hypothetical protein